MADLNDEILVGMIDEVFEQAEDVINDLEETNEIEQPADDSTIPEEDTDSGQASDDTPETVQAGDLVEPDEEDIITEQQENDLTEYAVTVQESQVTPIIENQSTLPTIGNVEAGDRVMIALINGQPTVLGTVGSGDRQEQEINTISADVAVLGTVVAGKASISDLNAATARITSLETNKADVTDLNATNAQVQNLRTTKAAITDLQATNANVTALQTSKADVTDLNAAKGRITTLEGDYANLNTVVAGKVDTNTLTANYITASQIATDYAKVDATNINTATIRNAWVDKVMVQSGLLANQGTVYTLDAIQLNADRITAGTIDVQRLIVTVDNHKYMVQFDAQGTPSYQKLDGDIIQDLTITADKIVAGAVTAQKITTANIVGTGGWINLRNGTFSYNNANTGQGISWDGTNLNINASTINIGTTNVMTTINDVKDAIDNIEIGGRNLILDTATSHSSRTDDIQYIASYIMSDYGKSLMNNTEDYFTLSFDYEIQGDYSTASDNSRIYAMINGTSVSPQNPIYIKNSPSTGHYSATCKMTQAQVDSGAGTCRVRWNEIVEGCTFTVKNYKVEKGTKETSWTPAPEDTQEDINIIQTNTNAINLSPYFSFSPYVANDYWQSWSNVPAITFTEKGDGWVRVQANNTGTSTIRKDFYPKPNIEIKEGTDYTWLIEFRNNNSSGTASGTDFYLVQTNDCQFWGGTIKENIEGLGSGSSSGLIDYVPIVGTTVNGVVITKDYVYKKRFVKTSEATGSSRWTNGSADNLRGLACFTARCAKNTTIDYEVRVSIYEGRYLGEYKPYVDQKARIIANTANSTANQAKTAIQNVQTLIRQYSDGVLVCKSNNTVGALVNANGSFDITNLTWADGVPSAGTSISSFSCSYSC